MDTNNGGRRGRWPFTLAAICIGAYCINVALRILFVKQGVVLWRLNDVGEFLLVLVGMAFFVSGVLSIEEVAEPAEPHATPTPHGPQGGKP